MNHCKHNQPSRRDFLKFCLMVGGAVCLPWEALAKTQPVKPPPPVKTLSLYNINTGELLRDIPFWSNGRYLTEEIKEICYFCRDFRTGKTKPMDIQLLDQLYEIHQHLPNSNPLIQIISAYRSPATNRSLRRTGHRVAKKSYHMEGKALDIAVEGVKLADLRATALRYHRGGVGYYPRSGFLHIDTGPIRRW